MTTTPSGVWKVAVTVTAHEHAGALAVADEGEPGEAAQATGEEAVEDLLEVGAALGEVPDGRRPGRGHPPGRGR